MKEINIDDMDAIDKLAVRLDKVCHDFDPYEYADNEGSVDKANYMIIYNPYKVIEYLLDIIEEGM